MCAVLLPLARRERTAGGVFCRICSTKHRFPWAGGWCRCRWLRPGEKRSLTAPSPAAGSLRPEPARGRQREQEVRQQAQQEGAEGQPDVGHPPGHVLRGLAPLLRHQRDAGKRVRGFLCRVFKSFSLGIQLGWISGALQVLPESLWDQRCDFPREQRQGKTLRKGFGEFLRKGNVGMPGKPLRIGAEVGDAANPCGVPPARQSAAVSPPASSMCSPGSGTATAP